MLVTYGDTLTAGHPGSGTDLSSEVTVGRSKVLCSCAWVLACLESALPTSPHGPALTPGHSPAACQRPVAALTGKPTRADRNRLSPRISISLSHPVNTRLAQPWHSAEHRLHPHPTRQCILCRAWERTHTGHDAALPPPKSPRIRLVYNTCYNLKVRFI